MWRLLTALLLGTISLGACAKPDSAGTAGPVQIIVQFRTPVDDPANPAFVQQLSADGGAVLRFVRTLGTGAQLYSVEGGLDRAQLDTVVRQLRQRSDILYVEEDRRVEPAQGK